MRMQIEERLCSLMRAIRAEVFADYYDEIGDIPTLLATILQSIYPFRAGEIEVEPMAGVVDAFMGQLPEIKRLIRTDVEAVLHNDPAVSDLGEVVLCYPLTTVMLHYRTAHALYQLGVQRLPRMLTELAHSQTGVDIHPAAQIGESFCIDHGTGIVVGATAIIGRNVVLYQGVTLGAKNFTYDENGHPLDVPRHPILEDNVTVYSNTSILGRVRIGHDTVIGGNIWLTHDIPACTRVVQSQAQEISIRPKPCAK